MDWQQKFTTVSDMLEYGRQKYSDNIAMADPVKKRYVRFHELAAAVKYLANQVNGVFDTDERFVVSAFSENCMEWMFIFMASVAAHNIFAPINHQIKDPVEIRRLLIMSDTKIVYVSNAFRDLFERVVADWPDGGAAAAPLLASLENTCAPAFKKFVSNVKPAGDSQRADRPAGAEAGAGAEAAVASAEPDAAPDAAPRETKIKCGPDDYAYLMYTSGSIKTKGVMHSQRGLLANQQSAGELLQVAHEKAIFVAGLPLSHTYGLLCGFVPMTFGGMAVYAPNPRSIADYISAACAMFPDRELMVAGVPELARIMNQKIIRSARGGSGKNMPPAKFILSRVRYGAFLGMRRVNYFTSRFLKLDLSGVFFKAIKEKFGGRMVMPIGGGPTDKITEFGLRSVGILALGGYGTTEMAPLVAANHPSFDVIQSGTIGYPPPGVEVKIIDGEVCSRGPNMMLGYLNNEEATRKVIPGDGWYHTGDKGYFTKRSLFNRQTPVDKPADYIYTYADKDCFLTLRGRVDNQFANHRGENISPEVIENLLMGYPIISSCKVLESPATCVMAHIFPDEEALVQKYEKMPDANELKQIFAQIVKQVNMQLQSGCGIDGFEVKDADFERNALGKIKRNTAK